MSTIPKTKEQSIGYRMLSITVMEPQETFTCRVMKRPNIRVRLLMRGEPLDIEPKGGGNDVKMVTLAYKQRRV